MPGATAVHLPRIDTFVGLWAPMSSSTAASQANNEARVLVLGGGLAGLKCAHDLVSKHGFGADHVLLLEASTSIGGRIKTDTSFVEGFKVRG